MAALLVCCCEMMSQVKVSQWVHAIPCHACAVVWEVSAESTSDRVREKTPFLFSIGARNPHCFILCVWTSERVGSSVAISKAISQTKRRCLHIELNNILATKVLTHLKNPTWVLRYKRKHINYCYNNKSKGCDSKLITLFDFLLLQRWPLGDTSGKSLNKSLSN